MRQDIITRLRDIEAEIDDIRRLMERESREARLELKYRLEKGLTGEEAVKHYNDWMQRAGLGHLCVKS